MITTDGPNNAASHWLASRVPEALRGASALDLQAWQWLGLVVCLFVAMLVGRILAFVLARIGARIAARTPVAWDGDLVDAIRRPAWLFFGTVVFRLSVLELLLPPEPTAWVNRIVGTAMTVAVAWILVRIVRVSGDALERRAKATICDDPDAERRARGVATQVRVMRRVINMTVGIVTVALVLTQFELVRSVGLSLLASAGVAGVVLGLAAQKTLAGLLAGIQLTLTQPIRIGDVIVIEGEWGAIEEITLTYVVVKIWDERRLIVPITRFLDQPFQNWTMVTPDLLGTVFFYVDWTCPIDAMRAELERIVVDHPAWDRRVQSVQVTNTKDLVLEVRALVSASDATKLWDLRVDVRERIVRWLQKVEGGRYLPKVRLAGDPSTAARADVTPGSS